MLIILINIYCKNKKIVSNKLIGLMRSGLIHLIVPFLVAALLIEAAIILTCLLIMVFLVPMTIVLFLTRYINNFISIKKGTVGLFVFSLFVHNIDKDFLL